MSSWTTSLLHREGVSIFDAECIMIPINFDNKHWALAAIWPQRREITYADSAEWFHKWDKVVERVLRRWLRDECADKCGRSSFSNAPHPDSVASWKAFKLNSREQDNLIDCGVFVIVNAFLISLGLESFLCEYKSPVLDLRRNMCSLIVTGSMPPHYFP